MTRHSRHLRFAHPSLSLHTHSKNVFLDNQNLSIIAELYRRDTCPAREESLTGRRILQDHPGVTGAVVPPGGPHQKRDRASDGKIALC